MKYLIWILKKLKSQTIVILENISLKFLELGLFFWNYSVKLFGMYVLVYSDLNWTFLLENGHGTNLCCENSRGGKTHQPGTQGKDRDCVPT